MTGIQDVVFRIPEEWDPVWFQGIIQDLFQFADARNVIGIDLLITGDSDVVATYQVDSQNVDLAEGLETRALIGAMSGRIDELVISKERDRIELIGMRERIEELEISKSKNVVNGFRERLEQLENEVA